MDEAKVGARFGRLVVEFLLIVTGVSVALAADALWEFRGERQREAEYLAQIRADLAENERRLVEAMGLEEMTEARPGGDRCRNLYPTDVPGFGSVMASRAPWLEVR